MAHRACVVHSQVSSLKHEADRHRKDHTKLRMLHDKEVLLLRDQLGVLRAALKLSEKECEEVKRDLDKEVRDSE